MSSTTTTCSPEVFARLADLVRDEFGCPDLDVTPDTSALDVDGWTSLTHTMLLMRVEAAFGITLPTAQAASVNNLGELAELVQGLVPNGEGSQGAPNETASAEQTRWVILHGNCQMAFASVLMSGPLRTRGYSFAHTASWIDPDFKNEPEPEQIANCAVFIEQVSPYNSILPAYAQHLPADCRRLRVPALLMKSLWPLGSGDRRNKKAAGFNYGRHPYGDSLAQRLMRQHNDPEVVFRQYMNTDLRTLVNLDRLHEIALAEMVAADKLADVPFAPIIEENFRVRRLFDTANHPSHELMGLLSEVLLAFVLGDDGPMPPMLPSHQHIQVPIHPQVIEHFKLEWVTPSARYLYRDGWRPVTFEQWLQMYINWQ